MKRVYSALAAALLAIGGATGCTTAAYCFADCEGDSGVADAVGETGGSGGGILSDAPQECILNCGDAADATSECQTTNGGIEMCDGVDNDCNGAVDDGIDLTRPEHCGTCANNCVKQVLNAAAATCTPATGGGPGACGYTQCTSDYWDLDGNAANGCEYYCIKSATVDSTCDGKDDDCDGQIDEDVDKCGDPSNCGKCGRTCVVANGDALCTHTGTAACDETNTACSVKSCQPGWVDLDGNYATGCEYQCPQFPIGPELCDNVDNDCDGLIDQADPDLADPSVGVTCFGGTKGACADPAAAGTTSCHNGVIKCDGANLVLPGTVTETCNGKDDDCDGAVDGTLESGPSVVCTSDADCASQVLAKVCRTGLCAKPPSDEGGSCGSAIGACTPGVNRCQAGAIACVGAIGAATEICNGVDDDCNGTIDDNPTDVGAPCSVPTPPPAGATSPCVAGAMTCVSGAKVCAGAVTAQQSFDLCGVDANCDGVLTGQPNTQTDVHNCGACGNDCLAGAVHANWSCVAGQCQFQGCQVGYFDLSTPADHTCEYPCTFVSAAESCNGVDDNCNGQIDENVAAPSPTQVCGVSPGATAPECSPSGAANPGGVAVACVGGAWKCTFNTAGVCSPTCAGATEICDVSGPALDNNCNGIVNENVPNYGQPCASDTGKPAPGDGACRTTGTYVCATATTTKCSAVTDLTKAGPELCDGIDNDCDGLVDEPFSNKGSNATYFVKPAVVKVAAATWIYEYEASRPSATNVVPGTGNGYACATTPCPGTAPAAPAGVTLDKTVACSVPSKIPWFNVTPVEVEQTCAARGGHVCTTTEWQTSCVTNPPSTTTCTWGYGPRGAACTSVHTASKFCNLGYFDFDTVAAGLQSGLLPTASSRLQSCDADWSTLLGNPASSNLIYDLTGNLREVTKSAANTYPLMGGSFATQDEGGAACNFTFFTVDQNFQLYDVGFRCCFSADPTL